MSTDLEQALSGEDVQAPEPEAIEEPQETTEAPPEAEQEAEAPVEAKAEPEPEPEDPISSELRGIKAALAESRAELREMKRTQPKPPPEPAPDFYEDPSAAVDHKIAPVKGDILSMKLELSRFLAEREYGPERVDEVFEYFNQYPERSAELLKSPSPFHAAVEYYDQQKVVSEIGANPEKWMAAKTAEITAQVKAELVAEQAKAAAGKPAPSMANLTGTGGGPKSNWTGPSSLEDILGE